MDSRLLQKALRSPCMWGALIRLSFARLLGKPSVILRRNGLCLEVGTGPGQGAWSGVAGDDYEPELVPWLARLGPGQVVVDIGANIGVFSLRASRRVGPNGRVISFEPISQTCGRLRKNADANDCSNITILEKAVGDTVGKIKIRTSGHLSSASITNPSFVHATEVELTTLDEETGRLGLSRVDAIKMDIEGAEPLAIRGMAGVLSAHRPLILFENGTAGGETSRLLEAFGYEIGSYDSDQSWVFNKTAGNLFARPKC